jgi:hypothetical protein
VDEPESKYVKVVEAEVEGLKFTVKLPLVDASTASVVVPREMVVETTPHGFKGEDELRGAGARISKSVELLFASVHPLFFLKAAVVLDRVAVGAVSEQFAADPKPTKSTTDNGNGQPVPVKAIVVFTRATLPAVALIAIDPLELGVGKSTVPPVPAASCIR